MIIEEPEKASNGWKYKQLKFIGRDNVIRLVIPGEPVAKARPRFSKYGTYNTEKTVNYETLVKELFIISKQEQIQGMLSVEIDCYFGIPKNTSKVKTNKMLSTELRPIKKPDTDNVAKICLDALNKLAYKDDSQVVRLLVNKWYGNVPRVEIIITEVS